MIVVCPCGQKSRCRNLEDANRIRCSACRAMLGPQIHRQAARNADIVLAVAALLAVKELQGRLTGEEELIANVLAHHEGKP